MDRYFGGYFPKLGINRDRFLGLGRLLPDDQNEAFKLAERIRKRIGEQSILLESGQKLQGVLITEMVGEFVVIVV